MAPGVPAHDGQRVLGDVRRTQGAGQRGRRDGHDLAGLQRLSHGIGPFGLDAPHAHARHERLERDRDPGDESAAADADHDVGDHRQILMHLEPDRADAGHLVRVVEGVQQARALVA